MIFIAMPGSNGKSRDTRKSLDAGSSIEAIQEIWLREVI
jgi:hypothetical protein